MKTPYQKAVDRMNVETNRAIAQVKLLDKLYREMVESQSKEKK